MVDRRPASRTTCAGAPTRRYALEKYQEARKTSRTRIGKVKLYISSNHLGNLLTVTSDGREPGGDVAIARHDGEAKLVGTGRHANAVAIHGTVGSINGDRDDVRKHGCRQQRQDNDNYGPHREQMALVCRLCSGLRVPLLEQPRYSWLPYLGSWNKIRDWIFIVFSRPRRKIALLVFAMRLPWLAFVVAVALCTSTSRP